MVKTLEDYVDKIKLKYPYLLKDELKCILQHGFVKFFELNRLGADVEIENHLFDAYCGHKFRDHQIRAQANSSKLSKKLHMQYSYTQQKYDGYYYVGMTDDEFLVYKNTLTKNYVDIPLTFYKIKNEVLLRNSKRHLFRIHYPIDVGWKFTKNRIKKKDLEYFAYKDEHNKIIERNG